MLLVALLRISTDGFGATNRLWMFEQLRRTTRSLGAEWMARMTIESGDRRQSMLAAMFLA
jgi:hypothetical protein